MDSRGDWGHCLEKRELKRSSWVTLRLLYPMHFIDHMISHIQTVRQGTLNHIGDIIPLISHITLYHLVLSQIPSHLKISCPYLYNHRWTLCNVIPVFICLLHSYVNTKYSLNPRSTVSHSQSVFYYSDHFILLLLSRYSQIPVWFQANLPPSTGCPGLSM